MSTKQIIFVSLKMPNLWLEKRTIRLSFFDSTIKKKRSYKIIIGYRLYMHNFKSDDSNNS